MLQHHLLPLDLPTEEKMHRVSFRGGGGGGAGGGAFAPLARVSPPLGN